MITDKGKLGNARRCKRYRTKHKSQYNAYMKAYMAKRRAK